MANQFFRFKEFTIQQDNCAMKVGTDGVLLGAWADIENAEKIIDIGTGTGLIAIMLAQRSKAMVHAVEIDEKAASQAITNAINSPWSDRIHVCNKSIQEFAGNRKEKYDLVVSNPPYFINSLKSTEKLRDTARHNDTLSHTDLLNSALSMLSQKGKLSIILPYVEGCIFIAEASKRGLFCVRKTNVKALPNTTIKRLLMEFSQVPEPCAEDFLVVGTGNHEEYTEKYRNLTSKFYLNF